MTTKTNTSLDLLIRISLAFCILSLVCLVIKSYVYHQIQSAIMRSEFLGYFEFTGGSEGSSIAFTLIFHVSSFLILLFRIRFPSPVKMPTIAAMIVGITSVFSLMSEWELLYEWGWEYGEWLVLYAILIPQWLYHILFLVIGIQILREHRDP